MKKLSILFAFAVISSAIYAQTGCVSGDCSGGYGKYVWSNGDTYQGYWGAGDLHGQGTYKFNDGSIYAGEFNKGSRQGTGSYTWVSGDKYTGQWQANERHGEGTFTSKSSGSVSSGIWKNGTFSGKKSEVTGCIYGDCSNGYGIYVWKNGEKYDGEWLLKERNGQGVNYFANGKRYDGEWKDNKRNGYGSAYDVNNKVKSGLWEFDKYMGSGKNTYGCISGNCKDGYGIYTWKDGDKYDGYWKNGNRDGEGFYTFPSGATYSGNWKNGQKHGNGTHNYKPSSTYKSYSGDYISGKMTGAGTFTYKNGDKYIGELKDNNYEGEGTMYYVSGEVKQGKWSNNKYIGASASKSGCISGDCDNGYGTYLYKDGSKYSGNYAGGTMEGEGKYNTASGDIYIGEFSAGTYNGQGTYLFSTGRKYIGGFSSGKYQGLGSMFYTDGTSKVGMWENDKFVAVNKEAGPPKITWITPEYVSTESGGNIAKVKLCVKSKSELEKVELIINGELKANIAARGFAVVSSTCDFTIEREISIAEGANKIEFKITNSGGTTTSAIRTITMKKAIVVTDQKRYALVIGNSSYLSAPLKNPANDAKAIAAEMRILGFEVMEYTDMSQTQMKKRIREFGNKLAENKGVGLFYYAGHGLQLNGENYLVPVDADIKKEQDIELEAVNLKRILGEMDYAQNDLNIVILDACRNNPFARSFRSAGGSGLATPTAPSGTFIAYATAPGSVASDGSGVNGLYTQELIKALRVPNVKIEDVFKSVRGNVYKMSDKKQLPWENSSIFGDFYFKQ